jgi:two-component system, NarL family, nitrate/nitrite response regulator NarL
VLRRLGVSKLTSVFVVADIGLYREALAHALARLSGITLSGTAECAAEAVGPIVQRRPDVVLVDVAAHGLATVRSIAAAAPEAKIVVLAQPEAEGDVIAFAEAGASGYAPRDGTVTDLETVITSVAQGEAVLSPRLAAGVLRRLADLAANRSEGKAHADARLTSRETEIVRLIDEGLSNKEIAQRLSIALSTVKNHVHSILGKLNVERRAAAVACVRAAHSPGATQAPVRI